MLPVFNPAHDLFWTTWFLELPIYGATAWFAWEAAFKEPLTEIWEEIKKNMVGDIHKEWKEK